MRASDLRAVARLATQATSGISRVAEGVHQSVLGTLGLLGVLGLKARDLIGFTFVQLLVHTPLVLLLLPP